MGGLWGSYGAGCGYGALWGSYGALWVAMGLLTDVKTSVVCWMAVVMGLYGALIGLYGAVCGYGALWGLYGSLWGSLPT